MNYNIGAMPEDGTEPIPEVIEPECEDCSADPAKKILAIDFSEWRKNPPQYHPEVISGIVRKGDYLLIGGASKARKTWTAMGLVTSLVTGQEWFGRKIAAGRVLYCNFELHGASFFRRVESITRKMQVIEPPTSFNVLNLKNTYHTPDEYLQRIASDAEELNVDLVVIDPIYKMYGENDDENSNAGIGRILQKIRAALLNNDGKYALILVHHFSKGNQSAKNPIDRFAGAGAFARDADSMMLLTEHEEEDCTTVDYVFRDFAPIEPHVMKWQYPLWIPTAHNPEKLKKPGNNKSPKLGKDDVQMLIDLYEQSIPTNDLKNRIREKYGMGTNAVDRLISDVVDKGWIYRISSKRLSAKGITSSWVSRHEFPDDFVESKIQEVSVA